MNVVRNLVQTLRGRSLRSARDLADASLYLMRHGTDSAYESDIRRLVASLGVFPGFRQFEG